MAAEKDGNPLYKVYIFDPGENGKRNSSRVVAEIPEGVTLNIEQEYENPFKLEINPSLKATFELITSKLFKDARSLNWDHNLMYTWMGGSPLQLQLDLELVAYDSVQRDIITPAKDLMKMSLPTANASKDKGGLLKAAMSPPPRVNISIGNMLNLQNVIITQVSPQLERPLVSDDGFSGAPMKMPISITIQTLRIMTRERVDEYFFTGKQVGG